MTQALSIPLIHWSAEPLREAYSVPQAPTPDFKPKGLWFSVGDGDDGWRAWCEGESFHLECLAHATELTLKADAGLLVLEGPEAIDFFTERFARKVVPEVSLDLWIDWRAVAYEYPGIIIAPYCWERRLDGRSSWYYPWDVASGVVWDARAIVRLEPWKGKKEAQCHSSEPIGSASAGMST